MNDDESHLITLFRDALKERSKNENVPLKHIYDDESLRYILFEYYYNIKNIVLLLLMFKYVFIYQS